MRLIKAASWLLSIASGLIALLISVRVRPPLGVALLLPKVLAGATATVAVLSGSLGAILGILWRSPVPTVIGATGAAFAGRYASRIAQREPEMTGALSDIWQRRPLPDAPPLPATRWQPVLPDNQDYDLAKDIVYAVVPGSERSLLCDVWQPMPGAYRSGTAMIYLHGGAWHFLDKDFGTRFFFRHLVSQGHVIFDVSYRQCPETDVFGMVGDVKRAINWVKQQEQPLSVRPDRVVISGGSAGGHLALLAAYTPEVDDLTPVDLRSADCSVRAVVSYYGPSDLTRWVRQAEEVRAEQKSCICTKPIDTLGEAVWSGFWRLTAYQQGVEAFSVDQMMTNMVGIGEPEQQMRNAIFASPMSHISPACPPTLIFHGEHDSLVPVEDSRALYSSLAGAGVPAIYVELPKTEHAFDFFARSVSPPFQTAVYYLDRFLLVNA